MTEYDPISVSDDYYDDLVEAGFVEKLVPSDVIKVMEIILQIATSKAAQGIFFVGLPAIEINLEKVKVVFRFSKRQEDLSKLDAPDRDELPRKMARFIWHLFARIDSSYKFSDTTLPSGFRFYIDLDE